MAIKYDMMANAIVVVSFVVALSAVCFYVLNAPSSTGTQHQSRCRRSRSQRAQHHAMAGFGCKEMRRYSPSNILLPDVNYLPTAYYTPIDQCFPVVSHMYFHPSGPHAIRVYIPPPTPTTKRSYFPSLLPIPVTYFPSFMIPHYHDPYGPTALQIYSSYTPPLVELRSIRDVIGLGQDDNMPMPCHHNEATPFLSHPMLSALPTQSDDFSAVPPHFLVFPVLGLCLVVALGLFALFCALKKLRHREPVAELEENHLASSSFELVCRKLKFLKKNEVCDNIPNKHKSTRNERLKAQRESRSNNGFPIKTKFPPKSKFVPRKRRLSDVSMHLYQLDLLWNSHNEQSISGTFALYCTLYCAIKRRRYHKPDVDNFEFEEKISQPSSTDAVTSECKENISAQYSDDPPLLNHQNINNSFSEGNQMWAQSSLSVIVSTEFELNDNIAEPSFYEGPNEHEYFQQKEECDLMCKKDKSFEAERSNEQTEPRMNDPSSTKIAEEVNEEPPELSGMNKDLSLLYQQDIKDSFVEGDQMWTQSSLSEDAEKHDFKEKLSEPSSSSFLQETTLVEPNNIELEKEECHNIHGHDNLIVAQPSKKNLWGRSTQQQLGSRWYIATGMGKSNKHLLLKSNPVRISTEVNDIPLILTSTTSTMQPAVLRWSIPLPLGQRSNLQLGDF